MHALIRRGIASFCAAIAIAGSSSVALAAGLTQPNGAAIPSPMGCANNAPTGLQAAMACACTQPGTCNVGAPCPGGATSCDDGKHGTCEATIWHSPNDNACIPSNVSGLDPSKQAATTPETFHPTCALDFTVVTRGTAKFQDVFGWYNAGTSAPALGDLHPMLQCGDAAGHAVTLDLTKEPAYQGGDIGFFLLTPEDRGAHGQCAGGDCCASIANAQAGKGYVFYSQKSLNPDQTNAAPYIHLLVLQSTITPHKFYFAWEDTFDTASADFTDMVTGVDGVDCTGGGAHCGTGLKGICAQGVTVCANGGDVSCQPLQGPKPETCDGLDDDCDGAVDDGATCPTAGDVCVNGACVPPCTSVEFPCAGGTACDAKTGLCVDPKCIGVSCPSDEVCYAGACTTPCDGVACPSGQTCVGDACVDLCKSLTCAAGQTCKEGTCFAGCATCGGIACSAPLACDQASGGCVDPSCANGCPSGRVCKAGSCVDGCDGVTCPHGESCVAGACVASSSTVDGGGLSSSGAGVGANGEADGGANGETSDYPDVTSKACACNLQPSRDASEIAGGFFALLAVGGALARRRRARPEA